MNVSLKVNLGMLLAIPVKRASLIVIISIVCTAALGIGLLISAVLPASVSWLPDRYTAKAAVLVRSENTGRLFSAIATSEYAGALEVRGNPIVGFSGEVAASLAMSADTIRSISGEPDGMAVAGIMNNLSVGYSAATSTVTLEFTDTDPARAERIVRSILEKMIERGRALDAQRAVGLADLLQSRIDSTRGNIEGLEKALDSFIAQYGAFPGNTIARERSIELTRMRARLVLVELQIGEYKKNTNSEDLVLHDLRERRNDLLFSIRVAEQDLDRFAGGNSKRAAEYAALERELLEKRLLLDILGDQAELADLNALGQNTMFYVLDEPRIPDRPSEPHRVRLWLIGSLQGVIFAFLVAYLMEVLSLIAAMPEVAAALVARKARRGGK